MPHSASREFLVADQRVERVIIPDCQRIRAMTLPRGRWTAVSAHAELRLACAISRRPSEFVESTKLFQLAVSLGSVESLIEQPATMSHASYDAAARAANGISDSLIRLSIGLEAVEDLCDDLSQALDWVA